jgi:excinuclease ABC subunit C
MQKASEEMNFERAAQYRDHMESVKSLSEKQRVSLFGVKDTDIILNLRSEKSQYVVLFFVRDGKLSGRESFPLKVYLEDEKSEITSAFIKQYYTDSAVIPKEIVVTEETPENGLLEAYLSELAGRAVKITVPRRGDKKALLDMAQKDVAEMTKSIDEKTKLQKERKYELGLEIYKILNPGKDDYSGHEYRVESYDISNTNGVDTVGGMVVFEGSLPKRKDYRRFKVRTASASDDYGSLQEIIYRRFKRAQEGDPGFSKLPDLIFVDGGKNQTSVIEKVLAAMKIDIPVLGMVKDERHRSRGLVYKGEETALKKTPLLYKYIGTVQEETHRFAIEYHRGLRDKKMRSSALDHIEGVGEKRRNALLSHFGSIENIKTASIDELCKADGITKIVAKNIKEYFN